jgi:hypothetical protein
VVRLPGNSAPVLDPSFRDSQADLKWSALRILTLLALLALLAGLPGKGGETFAQRTPSSSISNAPPLDTLDTLKTLSKSLPDSGKTIPTASSIAQDSSKGPKSRADTVSVIIYCFNHREQIITGSVIMTCVALILAVMNNYNPR